MDETSSGTMKNLDGKTLSQDSSFMVAVERIALATCVQIAEITCRGLF